MVKVKICGITNSDDAQCAIRHQADFIGLIFAASRRQVIKGQAKLIIDACPDFSQWVGVFLNEKKRNIEAAVEGLPISILQFHGTETPAFCNYFSNRGFTVIKTIPVYHDRLGLDPAAYSKVPYFLLDTVVQNAAGGTGTPFSWELIARLLLPDMRNKYFVAGGLSPDNIHSALSAFTPYAVDASSLLEREAGVKDHERVRAFIAAAHAAEDI